MKAVCILGSPQEKGNTATVLREITEVFKDNGIETKIIPLGKAEINFCTGCKTCEDAGECVHQDDMSAIVKDIFDSDIVVIASPSYWGDVTAQTKQFIDRCTPYGNTNINHPPFPGGKRGIGIAVRAGQNKKENENLISTIEHFLGHLNISLDFKFTVEGVNAIDDLERKPFELERARNFGYEIVKSLKVIK